MSVRVLKLERLQQVVGQPANASTYVRTDRWERLHACFFVSAALCLVGLGAAALPAHSTPPDLLPAHLVLLTDQPVVSQHQQRPASHACSINAQAKLKARQHINTPQMDWHKSRQAAIVLGLSRAMMRALSLTAPDSQPRWQSREGQLGKQLSRRAVRKLQGSH